jgi:tRNA nucleotidyltransferase/poly(A) polymerase
MPILSDFPELMSLRELVQKKRIPIYLVGGFLRDLLINRSGRDFDFAVAKGAIPLARAFAKKIKGAFVLLDQESGCARVARKKGGVLWTFDFADFRAPTFKGDLKKRDFTINTLSVDFRALKEGEDLPSKMLPNARARADIQSRTIRMASKAAFKDDPLRLLRAYSLAAQLGFRIDAATKKAVKAEAKLIREVSPERVREELIKVFDSPRAALTLLAMYRVGLLFAVVPQLRVMEKVEQGGYHHLDLLSHTFETIKQLEKLLVEMQDGEELRAYLDEEIAGGHARRAILKFACLLHDTGKPDTKIKEPGGRTSFHGHEHTGRRIARIIANQLMFSSKERYALEDIVTLHLRPGYLSNFKKPSQRMIFRFFRDAGDEAVAVLLLSIADQRSTRGKLTTEYDVRHHEEIAFPLIDQYFRKKKEKPFVRLINGHDLIKILKLKPGPHFAKILLKAEEAQHLGKVKSREEALALARKVSGGMAG